MKFYLVKQANGTEVIYPIENPDETIAKVWLADGKGKYRHNTWEEFFLSQPNVSVITEAKAIELGYVPPKPPVWTNYRLRPNCRVVTDIPTSRIRELMVNALARAILDSGKSLVLTDGPESPIKLVYIGRGEDWYGTVHFEKVPAMLIIDNRSI
jgi:hypothetical protein